MCCTALLSMSHAAGTLPSPVQVREQGENKIREHLAENHPSKNMCISVYFSWMGSLTCFTAQPPQQLCEHKEGNGEARGEGRAHG